MLFSSMEFLLFFFPCTLGVYFLLPKQLRNAWLLLTSLFFYAWGEPRFLLVMLLSIFVNYVLALRMAEFPQKSLPRRLLLTLDVLFNLGILFVFKYMNFVTGVLHTAFPVTKGWFEQTNFVLPIGISFFTFQAMSYVIDVYRGIPAQKSIGRLGLYISLFPQLIAGPIVRYTTIMDQLEERSTTLQQFSDGLLRFLRGFNKKVLLANIAAEVADTAFAAGSLSVGMAWLGALAYALQIFFDFSGYSDMAIGLGRIFGFDFLENFDYPYISKTVTEFWRRWHISLGSWFRDYVYFPLGGSRVRHKTRLVFNLFVVWLATGVWHGASWNFILWGVLYGVLITVEKLTDLPKRLPRHRVLSAGYMALTLLAVLLGWVLFRAADLSSAARYLGAMFGAGQAPLADSQLLFYLSEYGVILTAGILCSTPLFKHIREGISVRLPSVQGVCECAAYGIQILLFIVSISCLAMNAHNPFIYFNF